jgi:putative iron-dependent peroxidase
MKVTFQPGTLAAPQALGCSLTFPMIPYADHRASLERLSKGFKTDRSAAGMGEAVVRALGREVPDLRAFPGLAGPACTLSSAQQALWLFLRGQDRGLLLDTAEEFRALFNGVFILDNAIDTFTNAGGRDLAGYTDDTENPKEDVAVEAAIVLSGSLKGSSFVAVQQWEHDLNRFRSFSSKRRDGVMGRRIDTNEEIEDAPAAGSRLNLSHFGL